MVTEITMHNFDDVLNANESSVKIVMFFGATCGPCKATIPHYEAAVEFFQTRGCKIECFKINAWEPVEQKEFCSTVWKIHGVPHFKAFFKGNLVTERIGGGDEEFMKSFLHEVVDITFKNFGEKI